MYVFSRTTTNKHTHTHTHDEQFPIDRHDGAVSTGMHIPFLFRRDI